MSEAKKRKPRVIITRQFESLDGLLWPSEAKAVAHDKAMERQADAAKHYDDIIVTPSGRYSVRCQNCGKRTVRKYSDDYVWCRRCQEDCRDGPGHEPDDDSPTVCCICGGHIPAWAQEKK